MKNDLSLTLQLSGPLNLIMQHTDQNNRMDELDLFQLLSKVYEKRKLIITVTALSTLLATIFAFIISPVYQVQTTLSAPTKDQIQKIYLNTNSHLSSTQLFHRFTKKLSYKGNIIHFLQYSGLLEEALKKSKHPASKETRINTLNKLALSYQTTFIHHNANDVKDNFKDNSLEALLSTSSSKLDLDAKNNRAYLTYTNLQILTDIIQEQRAIVEKKIKKLEKQIHLDLATVSLDRTFKIKQLENVQSLELAKINTQIEALKQRDLRDRQLQLQELNNALKIASALGITSPNTFQRVDNQGVVIDVNSNRNDLYMRGTTYLKNAIEMVKKRPHTINYDRQLSALQEKIDIIKDDQTIIALKNRLDDKPYIKNIAQKQIELNRLKSLSYDLSNVKTYSINGMPMVETSPIKPKKRLILIFGFVIGALLSCFIVFIQSIFQIRKIQEVTPFNTQHNND